MKTILIATDFSAEASNAMIYGAQLAKAMQTSVILFHVYSIPTSVTDIALMMVSVEELQRENEDRVKKDAANLVSTYGIEVDSFVRIGIPSDEIRIFAEEKNVDLVIMAISGQGASSKFFGSTTLTTMQKCKKPSLIIPKNASFAGIENITYATDFSHASNLDFFSGLMQIITQFNSALKILHIQQSSKKSEDAEAKNKLEEIFKDIPHNLAIIDSDTILNGINKFSQENNTQLLVMTMHKHNFVDRFFGKNFTKEVANETQIPLLILHDQE
jgi:nucleotide-binding universal stress UspA family protein